MKQGGDFGKDLAAILQERLEAEHVYSKSLSKMASKLNKTCREIPGSLAEAWRAVATEMESRSEVHRQFSKSLTEEIVKPLKEMLESQHKTRKTVKMRTASNHAFNCTLNQSAKRPTANIFDNWRNNGITVLASQPISHPQL